ncbi:MAG: hypothetical protein AAB403_20515 [Planctomycetota bacterium]
MVQYLKLKVVPNVSHRCCFVHIGVPRTGSTALEKFFYDRRSALLRHGVLYPDVSLRGYGHHDVAFLLSGGYPDWAIAQPRPLAELAAELQRSACDHSGDVLISSENFYLFPAPSALRELLESTGLAVGRRTVIVVYLRRQDDVHESWYNQTVKAQGATHGIGESVRRWHDLWDYRARLAEWSSVFGPENILVRVYGESRFEGGSLASDFLAATGIRTGDPAPTAEQVNGRVNRDVLEFQRLVNRLPLQHVEKRRFLQQLTELTARTAGSGLFEEGRLLDEVQRRAILEDYAAGNAEVASRFLGREELFPLPPPEQATASSGPSGLTVEKMAYILGWLMTTGGRGG